MLINYLKKYMQTTIKKPWLAFWSVAIITALSLAFPIIATNAFYTQMQQAFSFSAGAVTISMASLFAGFYIATDDWIYRKLASTSEEAEAGAWTGLVASLLISSFVCFYVFDLGDFLSIIGVGVTFVVVSVQFIMLKAYFHRDNISLPLSLLATGLVGAFLDSFLWQMATTWTAGEMHNPISLPRMALGTFNSFLPSVILAVFLYISETTTKWIKQKY